MALNDAHSEEKALDTELSLSPTAAANGGDKSLSEAPATPPSGDGDAEPKEAGDEVVRTVTGLKVRLIDFQIWWNIH